MQLHSVIKNQCTMSKQRKEEERGKREGGRRKEGGREGMKVF